MSIKIYRYRQFSKNIDIDSFSKKHSYRYQLVFFFIFCVLHSNVAALTCEASALSSSLFRLLFSFYAHRKPIPRCQSEYFNSIQTYIHRFFYYAMHSPRHKTRCSFNVYACLFVFKLILFCFCVFFGGDMVVGRAADRIGVEKKKWMSLIWNYVI